MSQSATLYRVSEYTFNQLESQKKKINFDINLAKSFTTFEDSFIALEYILSKGQDSPAINLIAEIFEPTNSIGGNNFNEMSLEEQYEFYKSGQYISYLHTHTISKLNKLLKAILASDISSNYSSKELNDNGIYPRIWHNDNSPNKAYNLLHILEDFEKLKKIIELADLEKDYILVFVG